MFFISTSGAISCIFSGIKLTGALACTLGNLETLRIAGFISGMDCEWEEGHVCHLDLLRLWLGEIGRAHV